MIMSLRHGYKVATAVATRFRHQRQNMAEKFIEIRIPKAVLYLTATEILAHLPDQIKAIGLRRGKAFSRKQAQTDREKRAREYRERRAALHSPF